MKKQCPCCGSFMRHGVRQPEGTWNWHAHQCSRCGYVESPGPPHEEMSDLGAANRAANRMIHKLELTIRDIQREAEAKKGDHD